VPKGHGTKPSQSTLTGIMERDEWMVVERRASWAGVLQLCISCA
jgi:hypothetical protein